MDKQVILEIVEHCAHAAVDYMEQENDWSGTTADSGYLRQAILDADYSRFYTPAPQSARDVAALWMVETPDDSAILDTLPQYIQAYADSRVQEAISTQIGKLGDRLTNGNTDWHNWMRDTMRIDPKDTKSIALVWAVMSRIMIDPKIPCDDCLVNREALEKERAK